MLLSFANSNIENILLASREVQLDTRRSRAPHLIAVIVARTLTSAPSHGETGQIYSYDGCDAAPGAAARCR